MITSRRAKQPLGEILVQQQYITAEQLQEALLLQKRGRHRRLGQVLLDLNYISLDDILEALSIQERS